MENLIKGGIKQEPPKNMKHPWTTILVTAGLIALLTFFAGTQYFLLRQNAESERERMQRRVENDTARMAEDVNREVQSLLFAMQGYGDLRRQDESALFASRFEVWAERAAFPKIAGDIFFIITGDEKTVFQYDIDKRAFLESEMPQALSEIRKKISEGGISSQFFAEKLLLNARVIDKQALSPPVTVTKTPEGISTYKLANTRSMLGNLVILLNERELTGTILPELGKKYFPEGDFNLAVLNKEQNDLFTYGGPVNEPDAKAAFLRVIPEGVALMTARTVEGQRVDMSNIPPLLSLDPATVRTTITEDSRTVIRTTDGEANEVRGVMEVEMNTGGERRARIVSTATATQDVEPYWHLNVRHNAGSVDKFIDGETNKNLLIGGAVYLLLVGSILAIVFSSVRAKRFAQRQVDFVSSVSHEFRTPLAVIYSAGENLADGVAKEPEQIELYGNLVRNEGRKLSRMVEQILEFAGAQGGRRKYNFAETDIGGVINEAITECSPLMKEKGFVLETGIADDLSTINGDADALTGAMQNLLVNAIKYSNGTRRINITAKNAGKKIVIAVADEGIGIKPKDLKHIFEPFYRAKEVVDAQTHGNGLGLALVKDVVKAHKGDVRAESKYGEGSTFVIELPI